MILEQTNPIRVMVLSNSLNIGGAERFASGLLKGLSSANIGFHLVVLRSDIAYPLSESIPVHVLDYHAPRDLPRAVWRLRHAIRGVQPDVLLGVGTSVNLVAGLALLFMKSRPAWIARVDTNLQRSDLRLRRILLGHIHQMADRIVANSQGLQRALAAASPRLKTKIITRYNPVAFDEIETMSRSAPPWRRSNQVPLLVTAGRAHQAKRWDVLLEAFAKVVKTQPAELALCGDGPMLKALQDQARRLNLTHCVHFLGHCDNPFSILAQADLFILSSEAEGLPNALIEAQAMGLCAVATRCAFGPEEIMAHGRTGLLTAVNDSDAMAGAITTLLADDNLRIRMGAEAKAKVRRQFDFQARCRQWEALIRQVVSEKGMGTADH